MSRFQFQIQKWNFIEAEQITTQAIVPGNACLVSNASKTLALFGESY
jgi:hypothetical protein